MEHLIDDLGAAALSLPSDVFAKAEMLINQKTVTGHRYAAQGIKDVDTEDYV